MRQMKLKPQFVSCTIKTAPCQVETIDCSPCLKYYPCGLVMIKHGILWNKSVFQFCSPQTSSPNCAMVPPVTQGFQMCKCINLSSEIAHLEALGHWRDHKTNMGYHISYNVVNQVLLGHTEQPNCDIRCHKTVFCCNLLHTDTFGSTTVVM